MGQNDHVLILWYTRHYLPDKKLMPELCCIPWWSGKYGSLLKKSYLQG